MRTIEYVKTITNVQGTEKFDKRLLDEIKYSQDLGYEVDFKYAIENLSVHAAVIVGYVTKDNV